jgi:hypothetical protein
MEYFKHKFRSKSPLEIAGIVIFGIIAIIGFAALFGFVIMWLWNALMPEIFGLPVLSYWQAVGILILAKLMFGGFGSGSKSSSNKSHKWDKKDKKKDFSKWALYDKFWKEEGEAAYEDFIKRSNEPGEIIDAETVEDE